MMKRNASVQARILHGIIIPPHERNILRALRYPFREYHFIGSRGTAKSFTVCSMEPTLKSEAFARKKIMSLSASKFRGGKVIMEEALSLIMGRIASQQQPAPYSQNMLEHKNGLKRENDRWYIPFSSKTVFITVPTGNEETIRGLRAHELYLDEADNWDREVISKIVKPFLAVGTDMENPGSNKASNKIVFTGTVSHIHKDWAKTILDKLDIIQKKHSAYMAMFSDDFEIANTILQEKNGRVKHSSVSVQKWDYTDLIIPTRLKNHDVFYPQFNRSLKEVEINPNGIVKYDPVDMCTPAETPILMADWTSKPISEVKIGDKIVGITYEENIWRNTNLGYKTSHLIESEVLDSRCIGVDDIIKVTFASGRTIRCTKDHKWLTRTSRIRYKKNGEDIRYLPYLEPKIGRTVLYLSDPSIGSPPLDADTRWLAGIFDGEGSVITHRSSGRLSISQSQTHNPEIVSEIAKQLTMMDFKYSYNGHEFVFACNRKDRRKFYLWMTPFIKSEKLRTTLFHSTMTEQDRIVDITPDGKESVYALKTTTGNYIAWGYISKNCDYIYTYPIEKQIADDELADGLNDFDTWAAEWRCQFIESSGNVYPYDLIEKATNSELVTHKNLEANGWNIEEHGPHYPPLMWECSDPCVLGVDPARTDDFTAFVVIRLGELATGPYNPKTGTGHTPWNNVIWAEQRRKMTIKETSDKIRELKSRYNLVVNANPEKAVGLCIDARGAASGATIRDELANPSASADQFGNLDPNWKRPQQIYDTTDKEYLFLKTAKDAWPGLRLLWTSDQINTELVSYSKGQLETSKLYIAKRIDKKYRNDPEGKLHVGYVGVESLKNQLLSIQSVPTQYHQKYVIPGNTKSMHVKKDLFSAFLYACYAARGHLVLLAKKERAAPVAAGLLVRPGGSRGRSGGLMNY